MGFYTFIQGGFRGKVGREERFFQISLRFYIIYDAIAMAGGFTPYAKRREVKLLRKDGTGRVHMYVIDVTDDNIINSDFYYIYPNDILYVRPLKVKTLGFGEILSTSLVTSLVTLYLLVLNITKK